MNAFWITVLASIIPLWFLQNVIHELSHGLTMWFGWKWEFLIYPLPSKKLGRFTFAHITYSKTSESKDISEHGKALVSIMPKIVNSIFILLAGIISISIMNSPILSAMTFVFMWCNVIDFTVGLMSIFGSSSESDIWKFCIQLDIQPDVLKKTIVGTLCWFAMPIAIMTLIVLWN